MKRLRIGRRRAVAEQSSSPLELALAPALADERWRVPDRFNFTRDVVEALATDPKRRALTFSGHDAIIEPRTFRQLADGAAHWASVLRERGIDPGDRVLVLVSASASWLEVVLGCIKVGAVTVPSAPGSPASVLEARVATTAASLIVADHVSDGELALMSFSPDLVHVGEVGRPGPSDHYQATATHETSARDVAFVLWSSQTESGPRAVAHTHGATFAARVQAEHWLDAGRGDAVWCTADAGSAQAIWSGIVGPWSRGAEVVHHIGEYDALEQLDLIHRLGVTILCQTPAEYRALAELRPRDLERYRSRRLRRLVSTGDYLEPDVAAVFEEAWGMQVYDGYGQAETNVVVANGGHAELKPGSLGQPLPGHHVAVVDGQGNELPPGIEGDLAVRGRPPTLFAGYWDAPDETKGAFNGDWYVTGDVAMRDEEGYLWFVGRASDVIASRGRTFGPYEVEATLRGHKAVRSAAVVGVRDLERGGQFVRAFVVLEPRSKPSEQLGAELRQHVADALPEQHVPREVEFVAELPTTANGKVRRDELRERAVSGRPLWEIAASGTGPAAPAAFVDPAAAAPPAPEPGTLAPVEPEVVAFAEPEVVAPIEDEVVVPPEPEQVASPTERPLVDPIEAEVAPVEPEAPAVESEAAPVEPEPAPSPEPEPLPEHAVEPSPERAVAEAPEPPAPVEPAPAPLPEYVVEPTHDAPGPVGHGPEPEEEPDLGPLPEYVIDPERPTPLEVVPPPARAAASAEGEPTPASPEPQDPLAGLGLTPVEFPELESRRDSSGRRRETPSSRAKPDTKRSLGDPGDEGEEVGWMQGLSSRLSAYSLDAEPKPSAHHEEAADDDADDPDANESV